MDKSDSQDSIESGESERSKGSSNPFKERVDELARRAGSLSELARRSGISRRQLDKYREGAEIGWERALALAAAGGVSLDWLAGREAMDAAPTREQLARRYQAGMGTTDALRDPQGAGASGRHTYSALRVLAPGAAGGHGPQPEPHQAAPVLFSDDYLRTTFRLAPTDVSVVRAVGDAMRPTIEEGDLLLVDITEPKLKGDGVYVVRWADTLQAKRLRVALDRRIQVINDNDRYPGEEIQAQGAEGFEIVGRVIWCGRRF